MDGPDLRSRLPASLPASVPWVPLAIGSGLVLAVPHLAIYAPSLEAQIVRDGLFLLAIPLAIATAYGRRLGWRVDRRALYHAVGLTAFVLPFYVVGSSLPSVRAAYPAWSTAPTIAGFVPYALGILALVIAAETFYRGLLCVSVREIGLKCVLISPAIYVVWHFGSPPVEVLLAAPADVLFGVVDYRSESVLPSIVAHSTGFVLLSWLVMHPPVVPPEVAIERHEWVPGIPG